MLANDVKNLPHRVVSALDGSRTCPNSHALTMTTTLVFRRKLSGKYDYRCLLCAVAKTGGDLDMDAIRQSVYHARYQRKRTSAGVYRRHRLKKYGLTEQSFAELLNAQGGRCCVCAVEISEATKAAPKYHGIPGTRRTATATTIAIDHCHVTNKVRGLLCMLCNRGLGDFKDDPERLRRAADYLERNR